MAVPRHLDHDDGVEALTITDQLTEVVDRPVCATLPTVPRRGSRPGSAAPAAGPPTSRLSPIPAPGRGIFLQLRHHPGPDVGEDVTEDVLIRRDRPHFVRDVRGGHPRGRRAAVAAACRSAIVMWRGSS